MRRIALAIAVTLNLAVPGANPAGAQGLVTFASGTDGTERMASRTVSLGEGRLAAIAVVGVDPASAMTGAGDALKLIEFDPVTRLAILAGGKEEGGKEAPQMGSSLELRPGDPVYLPSESKRASRVVKWENTYRGKLLPLSLIRIHHPGSTPPAPGTALTNENGEVVAICHQAAPKFGNGTFALPIEVVKRVLKDLEVRGQVMTCWIGVTVNASNPVLAVEMVRPDSPGAKAGVEKGDILLAVGAREVNSYAEARNAFYYLVAGEPTTVKVLRENKERDLERLELTITPEVHPAAAAPSKE